METFEAIYKNNQGWVKGYFAKNLKYDFATAQDLTQDVFIKLSKHMENFDSNRCDIKTYIHCIAKNILIDYLRGVKRKNSRFNSNIESTINNEGEISIQINANIYTDETVIENEMVTLINKTIASFKNEKQRKVCELRTFAELSIDEIATELTLPIGTVKVYLMRFRDQVKEKLSYAN
jgi:RNA polymerase sigma-70 factor (ECF subfamily)